MEGAIVLHVKNHVINKTKYFPYLLCEFRSDMRRCTSCTSLQLGQITPHIGVQIKIARANGPFVGPSAFSFFPSNPILHSCSNRKEKRRFEGRGISRPRNLRGCWGSRDPIPGMDLNPRAPILLAVVAFLALASSVVMTLPTQSSDLRALVPFFESG